MQVDNSKSITQFAAELPTEERAIFLALRSILMECGYDLKEKMRYGVPFYYYPKRLFYLWPASIPWGGNPSNEDVLFGFCLGSSLDNSDGFLEGTKTAQIAKHCFRSMEEVIHWKDRTKAAVFESLEIVTHGRK